MLNKKRLSGINISGKQFYVELKIDLEELNEVISRLDQEFDDESNN